MTQATTEEQFENADNVDNMNDIENIGNTANMTEPQKSPKIWGAIGLLIMLISSGWLAQQYGIKQAGIWWVGAALGFTFYRSGYGFTRAWRNLVTGESTLGVRAHLLWLGLATILIFPLYHLGFMGNPVFDIMRPVGVMMLTGAFVFGIGMQLAGSCTSGSMYRAGSGQWRLWLSIIGIVIGAFFASMQYEFWQELPTYFVYSYHRNNPIWLGIAIQLVGLFILWALLQWFERARYGKVVSIFARSQQSSMAEIRKDKHPLSSPNWLWGSWSLGVGSIVLAVLSLLAILLLNRPWVISLAFPFWGTKAAVALGYDFDFAFWEYWGITQNEVMLERGLFEDPTSLMNIAFIVGAFIAARSLIKNTASVKEPFSFLADGLYRPLVTLIGGMFMGYGAIIGLGCNIGGFVAAVISGSIHGWAWVIAALLGTVVGVFLRRMLRL